MFRKLINTTDDSVMTILRLVLGVIFFAHGAQKTFGWFGGYGFSGTMGFFTQVMHIPAPLAFLAICADSWEPSDWLSAFSAASLLSASLANAGGRGHGPFGASAYLQTGRAIKGEGIEYSSSRARHRSGHHD